MTKKQVAKLQCSIHGCKERGHAVWDCCAEGNKPRAICLVHDIILNIEFMERRAPNGWQKKLLAYIRSIV